jgi:hypothetical protein
MDLTETVATLLTITKHTSQQWISAKCGYYLSQNLLRPGGLLPTLLPIISIDLDLEQSGEVILAEQLHRAAKLITIVPKSAATSFDYYSVIVPQVVDLILKNVPADIMIIPSKSKINSNQLKARFAETGALILSLLIEKEPDIGKKLILDPSFKFLKELSDLSSGALPQSLFLQSHSLQLGVTVASSKDLLLSISILSSVIGVNPSSPILAHLKQPNYLLSLFRLFVFSLKSKYVYFLQSSFEASYEMLL